MRTPKSLLPFLVELLVLITFAAPTLSQAAVPMLINYQGELRSPATGALVPDGSYNMVFRIFDAEPEGTELWQGTHSDLNGNPVQVANGIFSVILGSGTGNVMDASIFNGSDRWLGIQVGAETLLPRQRIASVAYSLVSENSRLLGGNEASDFVIQAQGLRLEINATSPNVIGGHGENSVTAGAVGATITGGGSAGFTNRVTDDYGTIGGGRNNQAGDNAGTTTDAPYTTVGGGRSNTASGNYATIAGGYSNDAGGNYATIAGGDSNDASGSYATVAGGYSNGASGSYATVAGGRSNQANASCATIGGGGPSDPGNVYTANLVTDDYGTIGGGGDNQAGDNAGTMIDSYYATVAGGRSNEASGQCATVGGGLSNTASDDYATVGGGDSNDASGNYATVAGGSLNDASGWRATIAGGENNTASGESATVGGGRSNAAMGDGATVGGGLNNNASGDYGTVAGGDSNDASGNYATVAGGRSNLADAKYATIAGGGPSDLANPSTTRNLVTDDYGTIAGGGHNQAGDNAGTTGDRTFATVGGGNNNTASDSYATVAGGMNNAADGYQSTVSGGYSNAASGDASTICGGRDNTATGERATVAAGYKNTAAGNYSFAAGRRAQAIHDGAFVWGDSQDADVVSTSYNQVTFRCLGGVRFRSGSLGVNQDVSWAPGNASWTFSSDRSLKENFVGINPKEVLERVSRLPIAEWNFKGYALRHIGPVAQDFQSLFPLGGSETMIDSGDLHGVALAAIQGLHEMLREKDAKISTLEARIEALEGLVGKLVESQERGK